MKFFFSSASSSYHSNPPKTLWSEMIRNATWNNLIYNVFFSFFFCLSHIILLQEIRRSNIYILLCVHTYRDHNIMYYIIYKTIYSDRNRVTIQFAQWISILLYFAFWTSVGKWYVHSSNHWNLKFYLLRQIQKTKMIHSSINAVQYIVLIIHICLKTLMLQNAVGVTCQLLPPLELYFSF